jgi:hypothetical protein
MNMKPNGKSRLRKTQLIAAGLAFVAMLHAQELAPELAPLAAKNKADLAALEAQKTVAVGRVVQAYNAALAAAEVTETTAGHVAAVAAITAERGDVEKNEMTTEFPANLPKSLQTARKSYLDGVARVSADFGPRQQRVNADYLRDLQTLQTRSANNRVLAEQIAAEKQKVLENAATVGTQEPAALKKALLASRWSWTGAAMETDVFMTFRPDGTVSHRGGTLTWKIMGARKLKMFDGGGRTFILRFNEALDHYKTIEGPELHGRRMKPGETQVDPLEGK